MKKTILLWLLAFTLGVGAQTQSINTAIKFTAVSTLTPTTTTTPIAVFGTGGLLQKASLLDLMNTAGYATVAYVDVQNATQDAQIATKANSSITILTSIPLTGGGDLTANRTFAINQATTSSDGYLTFTDWNTFNNKLSTVPPVSATVTGVVNNTSLQELGGVDKLINGVRIGKGSGNLSGSTVLGTDALNSTTTGNYNTAIGNSALNAVTTTSGSTAVGAFALYTNTASQNTAVGYLTMQNNTIGGSNVAMGTQAMYSNTVGVQNTAIGGFALNANVYGGYNVAIGINALKVNTGVSGSAIFGSNSVAIGNSALFENTTGNGIAIGSASLSHQTTGVDNIVMGYQSGSGITTGNGNTILAGTGIIVRGGGITTGSNNMILAPNNGNTTGITTGSGNVILGKVTGLSSSLANTVVLSDGVGTQRLISNSSNLTTLPNQTQALINADGTGKAIATKEWVNTELVTKQNTITLTTTGTSGAATFSGGVLNIPNYAGGGGSTPTLSQVLTAGNSAFGLGMQLVNGDGNQNNIDATKVELTSPFGPLGGLYSDNEDRVYLQGDNGAGINRLNLGDRGTSGTAIFRFNPNASVSTHTLTSQDDFKTINGESIVGAGDIVISGGGSQDLQSVLDNGNTSSTGLTLLSPFNQRTEIGPNQMYFDNGFIDQNISIQSDGIRGYNDAEDSINKLLFSKSSTGIANFSFPEKVTGDYILATLDDITGGSQDLQSVLDEGNSAENSIILSDGEKTLELSPSDLSINLSNGEGEPRFSLHNGGFEFYTDEDRQIYISLFRGNSGTLSLSYPDKPAGAYTLATLDDIPSAGTPNLQAVLDEDGLEVPTLDKSIKFNLTGDSQESTISNYGLKVGWPELYGTDTNLYTNYEVGDTQTTQIKDGGSTVNTVTIYTNRLVDGSATFRYPEVEDEANPTHILAIQEDLVKVYTDSSTIELTLTYLNAAYSTAKLGDRVQCMSITGLTSGIEGIIYEKTATSWTSTPTYLVAP